MTILASYKPNLFSVILSGLVLSVAEGVEV